MADASPPRLTLVSCLFDLARRQSVARRTIDELLGYAGPVLDLDQDLVIYADPELGPELQRCRDLAGHTRRTRIVPLAFEDVEHYADWLPRIQAAHLPTNRNVEKDTPNSLLMGWSKPGLLARTARDNHFDATHLAWIDLGIAHANVFPLLPAARPFTDLPATQMRFHRLRWFSERTINWDGFWDWCHCLIAAGWMVGPRAAVLEFADAFAAEAERLLTTGHISIDEDVIASVITQQPDHYEYRYGGYEQLLNNSDTCRRLGYTLWYLKDALGHGYSAAHCRAVARWVLDSAAALTPVEREQLERLATGPLLALVMIVKNEAARIAETLASVKSVIDTWSILDTGSTDGTPELICQALDGVPGHLEREPIIPVSGTTSIDFSATRNRGLELAAKTEARFYLLLNGDDVLEDGAALRRYCEQLRDHPDGAYYLRVVGHSTRGEYVSARLTRAAASWRYSMPTHEVLSGATPITQTLSGPRIKHYEDPYHTRLGLWRRDQQILEAWLQLHPDDHRTLFYLGQTHECLCEDGSTADRLTHLEDALRYYQRRAGLGGWPEEVYEAKRRWARCAEQLHRPWPEVQQLYLDAHAERPERAEPLWHLAQHYHGCNNHALAYLYAAQGAELPFPTGEAIGLDRDAYEWQLADLAAIHGFYLRRYASGRRYAQRAAAARPQLMSVQYNLSWYARPAAELFTGYAFHEPGFQAPTGWQPCNPTIMVQGDRRVGIIRTVNYRIAPSGHYVYPDGDPVIRTRNWWIEYDRDWRARSQQEIVDLTDLPRIEFPVTGYEDCRLTYWHGHDCLTAVACDLRWLRPNDGAREIVLLRLDAQHQIMSVEPQRGPWSGEHQKNWVPMVGDQPRWIYGAEPLTIIDPRTPLTTPPTMTGRLRGGSQALKVGTNWLWLGHAVACNNEGRDRVYLHRFVMSDGQRLISQTEQFLCQQRGIEFASGLALDGKQLIISFGAKDCEAWLARVPLACVLARLQPVT